MKNILPKIKIDYSTYMLIFLALIAGYIKRTILILLIVIIHELGHVFFFILFKIEIDKITIYPFGGVTIVNKKIHERIYKDILISLGGILFQLMLFIIFYYMYEYSIIVSSTYKYFIMDNMNIIIFNLLPIIPLDGSKLIFAIFSKYLSYRRSYKMMIGFGIISLIFFIGYNFIYRVNDIVIYVFLLCKLYEVIKEYKYVINKFYLERILDNHYYNEIVCNKKGIRDLRIDKYYYFRMDNKNINEKDYIRRHYFNKR